MPQPLFLSATISWHSLHPPATQRNTSHDWLHTLCSISDPQGRPPLKDRCTICHKKPQQGIFQPRKCVHIFNLLAKFRTAKSFMRWKKENMDPNSINIKYLVHLWCVLNPKEVWFSIVSGELHNYSTMVMCGISSISYTSSTDIPQLNSIKFRPYWLLSFHDTKYPLDFYLLCWRIRSDNTLYIKHHTN